MLSVKAFIVVEALLELLAKKEDGMQQPKPCSSSSLLFSLPLYMLRKVWGLASSPAGMPDT